MPTHAVFNQAKPFVGFNLFTGNEPLRDGVKAYAPHLNVSGLGAIGAIANSEAMVSHARLANIHEPRLKSHAKTGERVDVVEFHPSYHSLMQASMSAGLHIHRSHLERAAGFMMMTECEPSHLCPISMTYAVTPALKANTAIYEAISKELTARDYDAPLGLNKKSLTIGMGMTEKQGGSDVRANTTFATFLERDTWGEKHSITGHKWFFSAPMCDAFLVLAQTKTGLSCFYMPRILQDGSLNNIAIQRLKDKLGNKANASSEVEFNEAIAWLVGDEGRGVSTILDMATMTRLDCSLGTTGLMRQALSIAIHHASQREVFGKKLITQPLMQNVLADLALEYEAALALSLRLAHAFDQPQEAALARLLTPLAKLWICKRGAGFAQETMECLGGNGYVEEEGEGVMARIYREMPLNSIWEGAGNIMALDMLRAFKKADALTFVQKELVLDEKEIADGFNRFVFALENVSEITARKLAQDLVLLLQASLLVKTAPTFISKAFIESRIAGNWGQIYGTLPQELDFEAIIGRNRVCL